eukprot:TRINITY_DN73720_c0_g1_i1.p1 TRINITY_DN73720_c0_g1~~TRINITY_DN73720_c0_g1_i1.p1  ORF type:complete len:655 (-),score=112.64 TRINITY_DN73720_c0_g1_i1:64-2028(-)
MGVAECSFSMIGADRSAAFLQRLDAAVAQLRDALMVEYEHQVQRRETELWHELSAKLASCGCDPPYVELGTFPSNVSQSSPSATPSLDRSVAGDRLGDSVAIVDGEEAVLAEVSVHLPRGASPPSKHFSSHRPPAIVPEARSFPTTDSIVVKDRQSEEFLDHGKVGSCRTSSSSGDTLRRESSLKTSRTLMSMKGDLVQEVLVNLDSTRTQMGDPTNNRYSLLNCKYLLKDKSCLIETGMPVIIIMNIALNGLSLDFYPDSPNWFVVDAAFAAIFSLEVLLNFALFGLRAYFCGPDCGWNIFELVLVVLAVVEVILTLISAQFLGAGYSILRTLRLLRITRIIRVCRLEMFCDLKSMVSGALGSAKTLFYSMLLICIPLYSVCLILREILGQEYLKEEDETIRTMFPNVPTSFFTVFRCIVGSECSDSNGRPLFVLLTARYGWGFAMLYCLTMMLMTFGLFNVIVAIYVENTVAAAKYNDIYNKRKRLQDKSFFVDKTNELLLFIWDAHQDRRSVDRRFADDDSDDTASLDDKIFDVDKASKLHLTAEFFEEMCAHPRFADILRDLDIADEDQLDLFCTLDMDGGGTLDVGELVMGIAKLRGEARRADIVSTLLMVKSLQMQFQEFVQSVHAGRGAEITADDDDCRQDVIVPTL